MKILFCSAEVAPFAKTGGMGDVCGALPLALEKRGIEVAVALPLYRCIDAKKFSLEKFSEGILTTTIGKGIRVYFIENKKYFKRDGLYGDSSGDYEDNFDRFLFFSRKVLEAAQQAKFKPDIVHCHDWHTALVPVFIKFLHKKNSFYENTKSVLTIHNLAYQGIFPKWDFFKLGLPQDLFNINGFEFYDNINLLKAGILSSDCVTTVSPGYSKEIQTEEFGCGLEGVIRGRPKPLVGILNGIDYDFWNPQTDALIAKNYSAKNWKSAKAENKKKLQKVFGLEKDNTRPLFGFVARLSSQKGLDLIAQSIDAMMARGVAAVFQGVGDNGYVDLLKHFKRRYPRQIGICLKQDEAMAHQIFSGADIFLMPSLYEPCGLSQMISLRYGTIPLVFKTGGLADTITHFNLPGGNGFVFDRYAKSAFMECVEAAVDVYRNEKQFDALVKGAFACNFSWEKSALEYQKLYKQCLS